jgi:hypothetical protein
MAHTLGGVSIGDIDGGVWNGVGVGVINIAEPGDH